MAVKCSWKWRFMVKTSQTKASTIVALFTTIFISITSKRLLKTHKICSCTKKTTEMRLKLLLLCTFSMFFWRWNARRRGERQYGKYWSRLESARSFNCAYLKRFSFAANISFSSVWCLMPQHLWTPFNEFALVFFVLRKKTNTKKRNNSSIVCSKVQFAYTRTDKEKRRNF